MAKTTYVNASLELTTTATSVYQAPSDIDYAIITAGVCNNISDDTTLTMNLVDASGTASTSNEYISSRMITTPSPDPLDGIVGQQIDPLDDVYAKAGANSSLKLRLTIKEVTL
jgi:hypothetical protein